MLRLGPILYVLCAAGSIIAPGEAAEWQWLKNLGLQGSRLNEGDRNVALLTHGMTLTVQESVKLEDDLERDPNDIFARLLLIGYYYERRFYPMMARRSRTRHILWIIRHRPEIDTGGGAFLRLDPATTKEGYALARSALFASMKEHPDDARLMVAAAEFICIAEPERSDELIRKAAALRPDDTDLHARIGRHYLAAMRRQTGKARAGSAKKAVSYLERVIGTLGSPDLRVGLCSAALQAGDAHKAYVQATLLLKTLRPRVHGYSVHIANIVAGLALIRMGRVREAKQHLLAAGRVNVTPTLVTFGPNMALAKELLEAGERDVVLKYFDLCEEFWESGGTKLAIWRQQVQRGQIPNFGANMLYGM